MSGMVGGWITVTVLVLVLGTTLVVDSAGTGDVVSVTVAGGAAGDAVVVTVDVSVDVDTDVLVALAGLSTPQAMGWSAAAPSAAMPEPWWSRIAEPSGPFS